MKKPMSNLIRYTYGIVDLTDTIYNNTANTLFVFCLTNVMMFSLGKTLLITSVSSTCMTVATFLVGVTLSGTPPMKWGRHRSWLIIMAPVAALGYVFKFTRLGGDESIAAIFVIAAYIIGGVANSFCYISNASLLSVISSNERDRALLSRNRAFGTAFAGVIYSYTSKPLAMMLATFVGLASGYTLMAAIVAIVNMACMYYTVYITREYEPGEQTDKKENNINARVPLSVMLKCLVQNRSLIGLFLADIIRFASNLTITGTMAYYFTYVVQNSALMPQYILFGGIVQTVGSYASGRGSWKFSAKTMITLAEFGVCAMLFAVKLSGNNIVLAFIFLMLYRFAHGFSYSIFINCYADCVVYGEWKTNMSVPGFTYSLSSIGAQFGTMIYSWLVPLILMSIGFNAKIPVEATSATVKAGLLNAFSLIPSGIRFLGFLSLLLIYNLTADKVKQCQEEIAARKGAK